MSTRRRFAIISAVFAVSISIISPSQSFANSINEKSADFYHDQAKVDIDLKNYSKAVEDTMKAIEVSPHDANLYNTLGAAYLLSNQFAKAAERVAARCGEKRLETTTVQAKTCFAQGMP